MLSANFHLTLLSVTYFFVLLINKNKIKTETKWSQRQFSSLCFVSYQTVSIFKTKPNSTYTNILVANKDYKKLKN